MGRKVLRSVSMENDYTAPDLSLSAGTLYEMILKVTEAEDAHKSEAKVFFNGTFICMAGELVRTENE